MDETFETEAELLDRLEACGAVVLEARHQRTIGFERRPLRPDIVRPGERAGGAGVTRERAEVDD